MRSSSGTIRRTQWTAAAAILALAGVTAAAQAAEPREIPPIRMQQLIRTMQTPDLVAAAAGVTRSMSPIGCLISREDADPSVRKTRLVLIGGLDGAEVSVSAARKNVAWFYQPEQAAWRQKFTLSVIPCANPDGWLFNLGFGNQSSGTPARGYPPAGDAYTSTTNPETAYLWRWLGMQAPDWVIDLRAGDAVAYRFPDCDLPAVRNLAAAVSAPGAKPARPEFADELVNQLVQSPACLVGQIPALQVVVPEGDGHLVLPQLLQSLETAKVAVPSPAREEISRRLARSPVEIARQLSVPYGHELNAVQYIPALALVGRVRLGQLTNDPEPERDVEQIVARYRDGQKPALPARPSGSDLAGHLIFGELAHRTGDARYTQLVQAAADLGFDSQGNPLAAMPAHAEMSDAVFMACPLLAQAGRLTGNPKYHALRLTHLRFMLKLNLRKDGLHRHSPLDQTAWGRGNGFPALGLALVLAEMPSEAPQRAEILQVYRNHLEALLPHQDLTGCWHQVVDAPESYREFTATAMITYALARGLREGWLPEKFAPAAELGWQAIRARIAPDGTLVDVCTGTGKQTSLRAYYDRTAILGRDGRGGAMALMVSTEVAAWKAGAATGK